MADEALRRHLLQLLDWHDAHASFDDAVDGVPSDRQGTQPAGLPYSPWQLLEHLRLTQRDVLEFCRNTAYVEPTWPDDYWPETVTPPSAEAWSRSVEAFRADREALKELAAAADVDLHAAVPNGSGQTYLREILLVADHNAYHVGQLVLLRRLLGIWPAPRSGSG
jgi:uncharacterized damage-inducible protein DinB